MSVEPYPTALYWEGKAVDRMDRDELLTAFKELAAKHDKLESQWLERLRPFPLSARLETWTKASDGTGTWPDAIRQGKGE